MCPAAACDAALLEGLTAHLLSACTALFCLLGVCGDSHHCQHAAYNEDRGSLDRQQRGRSVAALEQGTFRYLAPAPCSAKLSMPKPRARS